MAKKRKSDKFVRAVGTTDKPDASRNHTKFSFGSFPNGFGGADKITENIEDLFKEFSKGGRDSIGSSIPFLTQMMGDWVINPSSVSLSTYQKMVYADPTMGGSFIYNFAIIAESIGEYYNANEEMQKDIRRAFSLLEGGKKALIRKMCTFMIMGFYIGEMVFRFDPKSDMQYVKRVHSLPQLSMLLSVDFSGNVKEDGIYQYVLNMLASSYVNSIGYAGVAGSPQGYTESPDAWSAKGDMEIPVRTMAINPVGLVGIPKKKCIYIKNEGVDGLDNPYGRSLLRSVYSAYLMKAAISQFLMIALDRVGSPMLVMYGDGTQSVLSGADPTETVDALKAVEDSLEQYRGTNFLILPGMKGQVYEIEAIQVSPKIEGFIEALNWCEKQIQRGILMPDTIFQGDSGGSYASNSMQNNIHNKLLAGIRESIMRTLIDDMVKPMLDSKYKDVEDYGYFKEEILSLDDKLKISKLAETMDSIGVTNPRIKIDTNTLREQVGYCPLSEEDFNTLIDALEAQEEEEQPTNVQEASDHYKNQAYGEMQ